MMDRMKTHEDEHSIGISFPTLCHILVYFLSSIEIHSKKSFRTVGLLLQVMGSSWRVASGIVIFRVYSNHSVVRRLKLIQDSMTVAYLDPVPLGLQFQDQERSSPHVETSNEIGSSITIEGPPSRTLVGSLSRPICVHD
jgi:hypothetical protein